MNGTRDRKKQRNITEKKRSEKNLEDYIFYTKGGKKLKKNKRLLVAYTRAAIINSLQQANDEIAEQRNQEQPHTQS